MSKSSPHLENRNPSPPNVFVSVKEHTLEGADGETKGLPRGSDSLEIFFEGFNELLECAAETPRDPDLDSR